MKIATYEGSIQKKFIRAIFLLISIVVLSGYVLFINWYIYNQKEERVFLARNITNVLSQDFVRLILLDDVNTATDLTTKLHSFRRIRKVILYNEDKKKIFKYIAPNKVDTEENFSTQDKLFYHNKYYGELYFEFKTETLWQIFQNNFFMFLFLLFLFLSISFFLATKYAKHFSRPILYLVDFLEKIEFKDEIKEYKVKGYYDDEIGKLYEEINFMFTKIVDFIQQKKQAEKQLAFISQYDALTGFLNQNGLIKSLDKKLKKDQLNWNSMFYIKLINLKSINNAYGYRYSDLLMGELAKKIKENFSDSSLNAHIGSGDFVLYYQEIDVDKNEVLLKVQNIADAIMVILSDNISIDGKRLKPDLYVGIDVFKKEIDAHKLLRHANIALETGRENHQKITYFNKSNEVYTKKIFNIFESLLVALEENQFELFYQPQYNKDQNIYALEALIRWRHPKLGLLPPSDFIPIAERTDLIVDIGDWVLEAVCKQLKQWQNNEKTKDLMISVNVSAKQFAKDSFVNNLKALILKYEIDASKIKLELLETLFVKHQDMVANKMKELNVLKFKLSLDDFGTGFSSLQYLKTFPLDQIKIDQSFVINMFENEKDIQIVKSIIYLGGLLGMEVIAEGVEKKEHYEKLKELGCRYFQGYYFAKSLSISDVELSLDKQ